MSIKLNHAAMEHAKYLIQAGEVESFDSNWNEEKPTPTETDLFIDTHTMEEYGAWFLGKNDEYDKETQEHYEYPYGDLKEVQRSALVYSLAQAEKNSHSEIAQAARELLELVDDKEAE